MNCFQWSAFKMGVSRGDSGWLVSVIVSRTFKHHTSPLNYNSALMNAAFWSSREGYKHHFTFFWGDYKKLLLLLNIFAAWPTFVNFHLPKNNILFIVFLFILKNLGRVEFLKFPCCFSSAISISPKGHRLFFFLISLPFPRLSI